MQVVWRGGFTSTHVYKYINLSKLELETKCRSLGQPFPTMKLQIFIFICLAIFVSAEDGVKKTVKRGALYGGYGGYDHGLGYGHGYGYGIPVVSSYVYHTPVVAKGYGHGLGYYGHGYGGHGLYGGYYGGLGHGFYPAYSYSSFGLGHGLGHGLYYGGYGHGW